MNNHTSPGANPGANGAHPRVSVAAPGPHCAAYAAILPVLDEPAADQRLVREARAHLATCAHCQARQRDYARLDAALLFVYGATATPTVRMEDVMPNLDGADQQSTAPIALTTQTLPDIGDTDETDNAEVSANQTSGRRVISQPSAPTRNGRLLRGRLSPLATLAAVLLIAVMVVALFAAQSRFRTNVGEQGRPLPPSDTGKYITSVSMVSPTDGWAIENDVPAMNGDRVVDAFTNRYDLLHYANGAWVKTASFDHHNDAGWICLQAATISMDSPTDGWATLPPEYINGTGVVTDSLLHYTGGIWRAVSAPTGYVACQVKMVSPTLGWAIGYTGDLNAIAKGAGNTNQLGILRYDGRAWRPEVVHYRQPTGTDSTVTSISALSANDAWVTATVQTSAANTPVMEGSIILRYHNGSWDVMSVLPTVNLYSASFTSASEGWAVGVRTSNLLGSGVFLHYHAGRWQIETYPAVPLIDNLDKVVMVSPTNGWAMGYTPVVSDSGAALFHYDGAHWTPITAPAFPNRSRIEFSDLSLASSDDVWVVGDAQWPYVSGYPTPVYPAGQSAGSYTPSPPVTALILRYRNGKWQVVES